MLVTDTTKGKGSLIREKSINDIINTKEKAMTDVNQTLAERGNNYGSFENHAGITQVLKAIMKDSPGYINMYDFEREALEMILHKIGRILNGNPHFVDSWHDIQGYARLVEEILEEPNDVQSGGA